MTRPVIIIGGGLGGLSAATVLEAARVPYTLIELKARLGGSIGSGQAAGFVYDDGRMFVLDTPDDPLWAHLGLVDPLIPALTDGELNWSLFTAGQGELVDALSRTLTGNVLYRMAVTSAGMFDRATRAKGAPRFCVCLENGTVLDAHGLIIAAPARHAERILRSLSQPAATLLEDYRYDSIARLSVGYRAADVADVLPITPPAEYPLTYLARTSLTGRVPDGGVLIQAGVRYDPLKGISPETGGDLTGAFAALFGLPENPLFEHVSAWPTDEPLMWLDDDFAQRIAHLTHALPDGVAVAGGDYVVTDGLRPTLSQHIQSGFAAAERLLAAL